MKTVAKADIENWITMLRSDQYKQCKWAVRKMVNGEFHYCAIGLFHHSLDGYAETSDVSFWHLSPFVHSVLMEARVLNDVKDWSFPMIADYLEQRILPYWEEEKRGQ